MKSISQPLDITRRLTEINSLLLKVKLRKIERIISLAIANIVSLRKFIFEVQYITYMQTLLLHINSGFRHGPDRWRQIYQNEPLSTEYYAFHRLPVDLNKTNISVEF